MNRRYVHKLFEKVHKTTRPLKNVRVTHARRRKKLKLQYQHVDVTFDRI